jgi:hypothetical protein
MKATTSPIYRWRVGEVEIIRVLEFEAALFEPAVIHPEVCAEIIELSKLVPAASHRRLRKNSKPITPASAMSATAPRRPAGLPSVTPHDRRRRLRCGCRASGVCRRGRSAVIRRTT